MFHINGNSNFIYKTYYRHKSPSIFHEALTFNDVFKSKKQLAINLRKISLPRIDFIKRNM